MIGFSAYKKLITDEPGQNCLQSFFLFVCLFFSHLSEYFPLVIVIDFRLTILNTNKILMYDIGYIYDKYLFTCPLNDSFLELRYTKIQTSSEAKLLLKFMGITALRNILGAHF